MGFTILVDFGSTFTKATVVDMHKQCIVYTFRTPSTVGTDASIGLCKCFDAIKPVIGIKALQSSKKIASSSAAGGLRMIVVGLTESLSLTAGKNAAYGAGAKIIKTFFGNLTKNEIEEIGNIQPEIILLSGGYENGNTTWVLENAKKIAASSTIQAPVVYAGNSRIAAEVRLAFMQHDEICILAHNIIPAINELDIESSVEAVRNIFMKRITHMKGFDTVRQYVGDIVMPTPAAVLAGVELLAKGTDDEKGWDEVMLIDMGGATTDVHSYAEQDSLEGVRIVGAPEPKAKRTVEGDIGARESVNSLIEAADIRRLQRISGLSEIEIAACRDKRLAHHDFVPDTEKEKRFEQAIAMEAVRVSVRRHAGQIYDGYAEGVQRIQKGKDLLNVKTIIGTGGPIIDSENPSLILKQALKSSDEKNVLIPSAARFYLDTSYIFYAAGLLAQYDKKTALKLLKQNLVPLA